jgi:glycosyltransferase involved in cell wall biosynthesis
MQVSVVMAVWNGERFVADAIASVLAQTHSRLELVVVDDGSTDSTPAILSRLAADTRLRVLRQANAGAAAARNAGLAAARHEWAFNLDADDLMLPDRIERQLSFIAAHPAVRVVAARAGYINERGGGRGLGRTALPPLTTPAAFHERAAAGEAIGLCHSTVAFHRPTILSLGGYRRQFRGAEDTDLWGRVADAGHLILAQDAVVGSYRLHAGSLMAADGRAMWRQHYWMQRCREARRRGGPEPTQAEAMAMLAAEPWAKRLDRERRLQGRMAYRRAGVSASLGRPLRAGLDLALATLLQPGYALPRLLSQLDVRRLARSA